MRTEKETYMSICINSSPKIVYKELPEDKRIIVISDIHGHADYLKHLLDKTGFCDDDILILNGDYLEKGTQSTKALRMVMELSRKENVFVLCGNCDRWRVRSVNNDSASELLEHIKEAEKEFGDCTFSEACRELGLPCSNEEEIELARAKMTEVYKEEMDFVLSLPNALITQKFVFVHGGLPDEDLSKLQEYDAHDFMKNDAFMEKGMHFTKYVVTGHWPTLLYSRSTGLFSMNPYVNRDQRIIAEDGGCGVKSYGQLNAFIIPNMNSEEFGFMSYDDLETVTAMEDQQEKKAEVTVTWIDRFAEILESGEEFSLVRHLSDGKEFRIPNAYLHDGEKPWMNDFSDGRLPVKRGEKLSVILRTSSGLFVKNHGDIGWYMGKYE